MLELKEVMDNKILADKRFGNTGLSLISVKSEEEIADVLRSANEKGKTVSIVSGGTKRGYGGLKEEYDVVLSLAEYRGIVEHTVGDMTVTVRPGTTIAELQNFLRKHDQMVSLDPSWPEQATIGGVIAANESGPKRLKYGSARDLVIGLRVVYPDGSVIRTGGKVVKNVAGYDMNKLFIGAMGTLGAISEITLKLRPVPKDESLVLLSVKEEHVDELKTFAIKVQDSMVEPVTLELVNPTLSKQLWDREAYTLLMGFEDVPNAVQYQEEWVRAQKPKEAVMDVLPANEAMDFWNRFANIAPNSLTDNSENGEVKANLKIGSKNMQVMDVLKEADRFQRQYGVTLAAHGGLGHGLTNAYLTGSEDQIKAVVRELRDFVESKQGYAVLKHLPFYLREELNVWGKGQSYHFLFEGIKRKVDPNNSLNHQRFVGGI
ncbi:FAD-binding oxidoreductase [Pseudalkalibacillus caeni]|uniref:FAD-binding oxidoreductase n=1 Tax=Exobacillus caeni TaxID=2574798 RepID=A0A5R9F3N8_9BACL|nr:FAD-binding oxidoreductase [Pseudalkalibacillus caeni]TLS36208.1 FAD-binding oxidoreductase [Pseudalkalibacillus caeni]